MSKKNTVRGIILLLITVTIWGTAFVAQSVGTEFVGSFTFTMSRSVLGGLFLIPVIAVIDAGKRSRDTVKADRQAVSAADRAAERRLLIKGGISCGVCFFVAANLQQIALNYTTVGKAGFITAMYIIFVPLFSIALHKKAGVKLWISVVIAVAGLYFLCMTGQYRLELGDLILLLCAIGFAFHILVIDHFADRVDGVKLSCVQFWTAAVLSGIMMLILEEPDWGRIFEAWVPICYTGIMSCGVAYTLQIVAQKDLNPTVASLIMSLESVVAALSGWLLLNQSMSGREILGCILMFAAIIIAQLPERKKNTDIDSE